MTAASRQALALPPYANMNCVAARAGSPDGVANAENNEVTENESDMAGSPL